MLLPILEPHINKKKIRKERKKRKNTKKLKKYWKKIKNILVKTIYQKTKEIIENWLRKIKIYKIGKFDSVVSTGKGPFGKENPIWGGKFKIECLRTQLEFFKV